MTLTPDINSVWRHHSGIYYQVVMITNEGNLNPSYPITVIYKGFNGKIWSRSLINFMENMQRCS